MYKRQEYIHAILEGRRPDFEAMRQEVHAHPQGQKFLDPEQPSYPEADLGFCLRTDRFDAVPVLGDARRLVCASR